MSSKEITTQLYKIVRRKAGECSILKPESRSASIGEYMREIYKRPLAGEPGSNDRKLVERRLMRDTYNWVTFMNAVHTHKALMEEYWPSSGLTTDEVTQRTAARVGLNVPEEYSEASQFEVAIESENDPENKKN